jgi:hypothetical protein
MDWQTYLNESRVKASQLFDILLCHSLHTFMNEACFEIQKINRSSGMGKKSAF